MVKAKKTPPKLDELPEQPIEEPKVVVVAHAVDSQDGSVESIVLPSILVVESKPVIQSDADIIRELQTAQKQLLDTLTSCPRPEFQKFPEDAVAYQDEWARWQVKVRLTCNRLNL